MSKNYKKEDSTKEELLRYCPEPEKRDQDDLRVLKARLEAVEKCLGIKQRSLPYWDYR